MSELEIAAILGGLLTILVNVVALGWSIRQTQLQRRDAKQHAEQQRRDTEKLTRLTSKLEAEVNRLSVELDQSLQQLHRANELTRHIHRLFSRIYGPPSYTHTGDEEAEFVVCCLELAALVEVIGDEELKAYVDDFKTTQERLSKVLALTVQNGQTVVTVTDQQVHLDVLSAFSNTAERVHRRVYWLLRETSQRIPP